MGNVSNYVTVTISRSSAGLTRAGFGTPLILTPNVSWTERTRSYTNMAAVAADFSNTKSGEYLAASAIFGQSPAPRKIKFGRLALPPTKVITLTPLHATDAHKYEVYVMCEGFVRTLVSFTAGTGTTLDLIAAGLTSAVNIASKNYTAVGATSPVVITGTTAGDWFAVEVVNTDDLKVEETHADPGAATDLAAIKLADTDFYAVYNMFNSNGMAVAIAGWVESNKKFFMMDTNESRSITAAVSSSDTIDDLKTAARLKNKKGRPMCSSMRCRPLRGTAPRVCTTTAPIRWPVRRGSARCSHSIRVPRRGRISRSPAWTRRRSPIRTARTSLRSTRTVTSLSARKASPSRG